MGVALYLVPMFIERPLGYGKDVVVEQVAFTDKAATTTGTTIPVSSYQNVAFNVYTTRATSTLKFPCSVSDSITFSNPSSVTNTYIYADVIDLESGTSYDGNAGIVFVQSSTVRQFTINDNVFKNCTAALTTWVSGTTSVKITPVNNE